MSRARRLFSWLRRAFTSDAPSEADRRIERVALVLTALATLWFFLVNTWEIAGPFSGGHWASSTSVGIAAENMWKHKIIGPVFTYVSQAPTPRDYYTHHPWGIFWTTAVLVKIFGHHDFVCRLAPVIFSTLTPPLLYGIGRQLWGPIPGSLAAMSFVVTPIALAFGNFNALEVPVIFGVVLATWGYLRLTKTWKRRWVAVSAFGLFHALNSDWAGYFFGAVLLAFMLPRGILFNGRWFPAVDRRRFAQWWALSAACAVGLVLFYLWQFQRAGQLAHLLGQGVARSAGSDLPLSAVLEYRAHWIELAFTPLAIFIGKLMLPVFLFRLFVLRRDLEIFPLAILAMAALQYVIFKQGADIHFFWPQYFAPYFGLAMGGLAASVEGIGRALARRFGRRGLVVPPLVALVGTAWAPVLMIPDGISGLLYARRTSGRYDERGDLIYSDHDKMVALGWMRKRWEGRTTVVCHEGIRGSWHVDWVLRRNVRGSGSQVPLERADGEGQYFLADSRFIYATELKKLVTTFPVVAVGPFLEADRSRGWAPLGAHALAERRATLWERYLRSGTEPTYEVVPDPFATWELRHHFGHKPNPVPTEAASSVEHKRILHNVAVASGDEGLAARLREELETELDKKPATTYADGSRLLGTRLERGVVDRLEVYFLLSGPIEPDAYYRVTATVEEGPRWSLIGAPERVRDIGMPFVIPTPFWRKGMIYRSRSDIRTRPGREKLVGSWMLRRAGERPPIVSSAPTPLLTTDG